MCLIIVKPQGVTIPQNVIESANHYNGDGFGLMYNGTAKKWLHRTPEQIRDILEPLEDKTVAVHFRMATDGQINKSNAHPFRLKNKGWLMHNGILGKYRTSKDATKSDTRQFVETFCNPLIAKNGSIPRAELEKEIIGNAIAIMQRDGIINTYGDSWQEFYGCQFSNTYAWDSGKKSTTKSTWGHEIDWSAADTATYGLVGTVYTRLYDIADMLPLHDCSYIAYEDIDLQDQLLLDEITCYQFLNQCTEETLLELYTLACNQHLI